MSENTLSKDRFDALSNDTSSERTSTASDDGRSSPHPEPLLSQDEIETLLNAMSEEGFAGEISSISEAAAGNHILSQRKTHFKNIRKYDFSRPAQLSRELTRLLHSVHSNYARALGSSLSDILMTPVDVECIHIEQLTYDEYLASLLAPSCIGVFSMEPLETLGAIEMNLMLAFSIIDRILGGSGISKPYNRTLTAIEKMVISKVMKRALKILQESWQQSVNMEMNLERLESNPRLIRLTATDDPVVLILLNIKLKDISNIMSLCLPLMTMKRFFEGLRRWTGLNYENGEKMESQSNEMYTHILDLRMTLSAQYESSPVTLGEFLELQKGDIIKLQSTSKDRVLILVEGQKRFHGEPGVVNGQRAIRICDVTDTRLKTQDSRHKIEDTPVA
jgi:flagellar motor switch protein FliM